MAYVGTVILPVFGMMVRVEYGSPALPALENSRPQMIFRDIPISQVCYYLFRLPSNYVDSPTLIWQYKMKTATSGNVYFGATIMAVTPNNSESVDGDNYIGYQYSSPDAVPATAGHLKEVELPLINNDEAAAGDWVSLKFFRHTAHGLDTASGELELVNLTFEYGIWS